MTKAVRHTKHEIENAAKMADDLGLTVRLEADGAITFIPANHSPKKRQLDHGLSLPAVSSLDEWKKARKNEGSANGHS